MNACLCVGKCVGKTTTNSRILLFASRTQDALWLLSYSHVFIQYMPHSAKPCSICWMALAHIVQPQQQQHEFQQHLHTYMWRRCENCAYYPSPVTYMLHVYIPLVVSNLRDIGESVYATHVHNMDHFTISRARSQYIHEMCSTYIYIVWNIANTSQGAGHTNTHTHKTPKPLSVFMFNACFMYPRVCNTLHPANTEQQTPPRKMVVKQQYNIQTYI